MSREKLGPHLDVLNEILLQLIQASDDAFEVLDIEFI